MFAKMRKMFIIIILFLTSFEIFTCTDNKTFDYDGLLKTVSQNKTTWKAKNNTRFKNKTLRSIKKQMGVNSPLKKKKKKRVMTNVDQKIIQNLPQNFDLRIQYPECTSLSKVNDQSICGCCWAYAAVDSLSDRFCILSKGRNQPVLSANNLVSCCDYCGQGCDGGTPLLGMDFISRYGVTTGGSYSSNGTCQPYPFPGCDHHVNGTFGSCDNENYPTTPDCVLQCSNSSINYNQDKWYISEAYEVDGDETAIMSEIFHFGSVEASMEVYEDFLLYSSGVYEHVAGDYLGQHAMRIIGWGVEDGVKYWLFVNTWNQEWGDKGLIKIIRGIDEMSIESNVVAGIPILKGVTNLI
jgi:cathepsin B